MNLYDEAIKELQDYINEYGMDYYDTKHYPVTIKALERAKKEHQLLGLYQNLWALPYGDIGVVELLRQIEQLEKELRELK